jgi:hypothetical protein
LNLHMTGHEGGDDPCPAQIRTDLADRLWAQKKAGVVWTAPTGDIWPRKPGDHRWIGSSPFKNKRKFGTDHGGHVKPADWSRASCPPEPIPAAFRAAVARGRTPLGTRVPASMYMPPWIPLTRSALLALVPGAADHEAARDATGRGTMEEDEDGDASYHRRRDFSSDGAGLMCYFCKRDILRIKATRCKTDGSRDQYVSERRRETRRFVPEFKARSSQMEPLPARHSAQPNHPPSSAAVAVWCVHGLQF